MGNHLFVFIAIVFATNLTGCAAVCSPVAQTSAMHHSNPIGTVVALAEFGACAGYDLAKIAIVKMSEPEKKEEKKVEQPAVMPAPPATAEPTFTPPLATGDADAI